MDRQQLSPSDVGLIHYGGGVSLHRFNPAHTFVDPLFGTSVTNCGRWLKRDFALRVDFLSITPVCRVCFRRPGAAYYIASDRFVVVEFFDQVVLDV